MGLFNFNTAKPKQFRYRPLYYDERKERLDKMKARAEAENEGKSYTSLEKGFLAESRANSKLRRAELQSASMWRVLRLLIILIIILGITYVAAPELFVAFWRIK